MRPPVINRVLRGLISYSFFTSRLEEEAADAQPADSASPSTLCGDRSIPRCTDTPPINKGLAQHCVVEVCERSSSSSSSRGFEHAVSPHLRLFAMEATSGAPRDPLGGGPNSRCTCCWPTEAFASAAAFLADLEELCCAKSQDDASTTSAASSPLPTQSNVADEHQLQQPQQLLQQQQQLQQQLQQQQELELLEEHSKQQQASSSAPRPFASLVAEALELLVDVLRIFGPDKVVLSFNGGKDAVVILHLYRAALVKYTRLQQQEQQQQEEQQQQLLQQQLLQQQEGCAQCSRGLVARPRAVYFHAGSQEFPEVESFVRQTAEAFAISVETYYCDWASGLRSFVSRHPQTPVAFVLGTRLSDPQRARETLAFLQPSSRWLPPFIRVQPLLHFGYGHIWWFLRQLRLPYCPLYDLGYSSIGTRANTLPNPLLLKNDGSQPLPAYELQMWDKERAGRRSHNNGEADG
ncbi:hypothetical protein Emag_004671 [Eimeria magna]